MGGRYVFEMCGDKYVIIDMYPVPTIIEWFNMDEYDIAMDTFNIYIEEENKSSQLDGKEKA